MNETAKKDKCTYRFTYNDPICRHPEAKRCDKCNYETDSCPLLEASETRKCQEKRIALCKKAFQILDIFKQHYRFPVEVIEAIDLVRFTFDNPCASTFFRMGARMEHALKDGYSFLSPLGKLVILAKDKSWNNGKPVDIIYWPGSAQDNFDVFMDCLNQYQKRLNGVKAMRSVKVIFENGKTIKTMINGTEEEIKNYYLNNLFNLTVYSDDGMEEPLTKGKEVIFL